MTCAVFLVEDAERDIEDIYGYISESDGLEAAASVVDALEAACFSLNEMPGRGNVPKELGALGITEYRELHYKPYRVVYRVADGRVIVYCVLDGRRDMQSLLQRRLLR